MAEISPQRSPQLYKTVELKNRPYHLAKRALGSEWLKNHSKLLEGVYMFTKRAFALLYPPMKRINPTLTNRVVLRGEEITKRYVFNCQMCGQCILHSTGMTCPMNCPKNLRNGPCGGVRANGHCEVVPEMPCVWVQAWQRSQHMTLYTKEMLRVQPPVNRSLEDTSSWINMVEGIDTKTPTGWAKGEQHAPTTVAGLRATMHPEQEHATPATTGGPR